MTRLLMAELKGFFKASLASCVSARAVFRTPPSHYAVAREVRGPESLSLGRDGFALRLIGVHRAVGGQEQLVQGLPVSAEAGPANAQADVQGVAVDGELVFIDSALKSPNQLVDLLRPDVEHRDEFVSRVPRDEV